MVRTIGTWAPFHIDALGIVTLLGAEEVNTAVGRLCNNRWFFDCLPLLAANLIAADKITKPVPGFTLYNVSDGIVATDVAGWFSRWLLSQRLHFATSRLEMRAGRKAKTGEHGLRASMQLQPLVVRIVVGFLVMAPILALAAWMNDWWGLANELSMLLSIWLRHIIIQQNHVALAAAAKGTDKAALEPVKVFLTLPDGKAVTMDAPRGLVVDCVLTTPRPPNLRLYRVMRAVAWAAFACHVVALGMSTLATQLLSLAWLLAGTLLVAFRVGDYEEVIGDALQIRQRHLLGPDSKDSRSVAYARLALTETEKQSMVSWHLFPQKSNAFWWERYEALEKQVAVEERSSDESGAATAKEAELPTQEC